MMKMNPWLLDKIKAFVQKEEAQLRCTEIEMNKLFTEIMESTDKTSFRFRIESLLRLFQQIKIALVYGSLMKLIYQNQPAKNDEFLLHKQDTLRQMIRRYQERSLVSVTVETNTKTGKLEVNIIRKQLHTTENRLLIRERKRVALQKYKSIMNDEGNTPYLGPNQALFGHFVHDPLKDCGSAKLRKERLLARLEARERSRDIRRHGLMQIHQDFMARIQRITSELQNVSVDQLELSLSALDLDDSENDK
ncbi:hypothetical protein C0J52_28394 [Blattella germanica]|nr:hypothetical protein C0J52_28394 [Blattella germanica]